MIARAIFSGSVMVTRSVVVINSANATFPAPALSDLAMALILSPSVRLRVTCSTSFASNFNDVMVNFFTAGTMPSRFRYRADHCLSMKGSANLQQIGSLQGRMVKSLI